MLTKEQVLSLRPGDLLHYQECTRVVGPRGGTTINTVECRVNGRPKTWKRQPEKWELPLKYGLHECLRIDQTEATDWHLASECPLNKKDEASWTISQTSRDCVAGKPED